MSEKRFVSEYVEIIDEKGSRQAVCVTDKEHTVSFEVKDEYVAMDLCEKLNSLSDTVEALILDRNNQEEKLDIARRNMTKQLEKIDEQQATIQSLKEENSNLNSILNEVGLQKPFIKILDDYMIEYDGSCFSMHKPSDIRSFVYLMNRNNNFDELQCEYNDESMVIDDE